MQNFNIKSDEISIKYENELKKKIIEQNMAPRYSGIDCNLLIEKETKAIMEKRKEIESMQQINEEKDDENDEKEQKEGYEQKKMKLMIIFVMIIIMNHT